MKSSRQEIQHLQLDTKTLIKHPRQHPQHSNTTIITPQNIPQNSLFNFSQHPNTIKQGTLKNEVHYVQHALLIAFPTESTYFFIESTTKFAVFTVPYQISTNDVPMAFDASLKKTSVELATLDAVSEIALVEESMIAPPYVYTVFNADLEVSTIVFPSYDSAFSVELITLRVPSAIQLPYSTMKSAADKAESDITPAADEAPSEMAPAADDAVSDTAPAAELTALLTSLQTPSKSTNLTEITRAARQIL